MIYLFMVMFMKLRMPSYCKDFKCKGEKCKDNCCIGWEIDIDNCSAEYYKSVKGDFGERLRQGINEGEVPCFKMQGERCVFLNERNLCDIIINLGENALCQICRDHPRYFEWFETVKEGGVGLCCEEGARLIISNNQRFSFYDVPCDDEGEDDYSAQLYECLLYGREQIINMLDDESLPLSVRLSSVISFAHSLQVNVDNYDYSKINCQVSREKLPINIERLIHHLGAFEVIDESWGEYIKLLIKSAGEIQKLMATPPAYSERISKYLKNIAIYFIWRYFMKGVFDEEILSKVWLSVASCQIIGGMFCHAFIQGEELTEESCACLAKNYSKEVEYSQENTDRLCDIIYSIEMQG